MARRESNTIINFSLIIIVFVLIFYVLYIGSSLIIPLIIAILFSFAIIGLSNFYKKLKIFNFLSFVLSLFTYILIFWLIGKLIGTNIDDLIRLLPSYQTKITQDLSDILVFLNLDGVINLENTFNKINIANVISSVAQTIRGIFSSAGLILFYVIFILLEYRYFQNKLYLMVTDINKRVHVIETFEKIRKDIKSYFVIKGVVSLITSLLSYSVMYAFDLDFAIFWAMLIFILNFIPSIGSIIAVMFPSLLSIIQFDSFYFILLMISLLVMIQILMGNLIEPKFMGNKLNLSPLVIIISLGFWGSIWGVIGMLLSVPIMVIINIILSKIPVTRPIAILLSEKGELQVDGGDDVIKAREELIKGIKNKFRKSKKIR